MFKALRLRMNRKPRWWVIGIILFLLFGIIFLSLPVAVTQTGCLCSGRWVGKEERVCDSIYERKVNRVKTNMDIDFSDGGYCTVPGIHSRIQPCLGISIDFSIFAGVGTNKDTRCKGYLIGTPKCYGVSITGNEGELPCDYPCSDEVIQVACKDQSLISFGEVTVDCSLLQQTCDW